MDGRIVKKYPFVPWRLLFFAAYLSGQYKALYPGISPANTFRIVLHAPLGVDHPLLDAISYDSPVPHTFNTSKVSNPCQAH